MIPLFLAAMVVGRMGFYFRNHGALLLVAKTAVEAWIDPGMARSDAPPSLAPLAFAGLGVIGVLASQDRFNPSC